MAAAEAAAVGSRHHGIASSLHVSRTRSRVYAGGVVAEEEEEEEEEEEDVEEEVD